MSQRSLRSFAISLAIIAASAVAITTNGGSRVADDASNFASAVSSSSQIAEAAPIVHAPPPNDTFAGAIPLTVNMSVTGNLGSGADSATNDYQLGTPGSPTCYSGNGQQAPPSTAAGRDVV